MFTLLRVRLLLLTLLLAGTVQAQTGALRGRVESTGGTAIAGAIVRAAMGSVSATDTTGADGAYEFPRLTAGRYIVSASAAGYATAWREGVNVEAGQTVTLSALRLAPVGPPPAARITISGTVVDNGTRQPIAGALVGLHVAEGRRLVADTTGRDGTFSVSVTTNDRLPLTLHVEAAGYLPAKLPAGVNVERLVVGLTSASTAAASVSGIVRASGQPVARARVRLIRVDPLALPVPLERTTGADGAFRFDSLRAGTFVMSAEATGYRTTTTDFRLSAGQALRRDLELRIVEPPPPVRAEVTGQVVTDGTRAPVSHARVTLFAAQDSGAVRPAASGHTDREGRFSLRVEPGRYIAAVSLSGERGTAPYAEFYQDARTPADATVLSVGTVAPTSITFAVPPAPQRVAVRVKGKVSTAAGAPLADAVVSFTQRDTRAPLGLARTGADGTYDATFEAAVPLSFIASARREGYATEYYREAATPEAAAPISVTVAPYTAENVSFTLDVRTAPTGALGGLVTNAASRQVLIGATVRAYAPERSTIATTGTDGRYNFPALGMNTYVVLGTADGFAPTYAGSTLDTWLDARRVLVAPTMGPAALTADLALAPFRSPGGPGRIAGKAITRSGRPVGGALVRAFDAARRLAAYNFSDERGGYELAGLDTGRHFVTVEVPFAGVWSESVDVDTSAAVQGVVNFTVNADPATGTSPETGVSGLILRVPVPNPARGAMVMRYTLAESQPVALRVYDALGRAVATLEVGLRAAGAHEVGFDAGLLVPGLYVLRLEAGGTRTARTFVVAR